MVAVGRLGAADWSILRGLRLLALAADPDAFGSTLKHEQGQKANFWRARLLTDAWFVALAEDLPVGVAAAVSPPHRFSVSFSSTPCGSARAQRGQGVGDLLVETVLTWARDEGATSVSLTAVDGNEPALRPYQRAGFHSRGERDPWLRSPTQMRERFHVSLRP